MVLDSAEARMLAGIAEELVACLDVVARLYAEDRRVADLFPAYDAVREFARLCPGYTTQAPICRLDGFIDETGVFRVLETNTACPGGVIQSGLAARLWEQVVRDVGTPVRTHAESQRIVADPDCFVSSLIDLYKTEHGALPDRTAVVSYRGKYSNEVDRIVSGFRRLGVDSEQVDASVLSWDGASLLNGEGQRLHLVYNKLDPLDLIGNQELLGYLKSGARGDVMFLSPLMAQWVLEDKAALAVLTDRRFGSSFSALQRELLETHVPWTRFCMPGKTTSPEGISCELLPYMLVNQEGLVLKPTNASRGDGVVIGATVSKEVWHAQVEHAVLSRTYVVQKYVSPRQILAPDPLEGQLMRMNAGLDVFVFGGSFAGFHSRASLDAVINIGKRGVLLPVVVLAEEDK